MEKPKKNKSGLHKEVSSIFEGVPIPGNNGARQPADVPASEGTGQTHQKPQAHNPRNPQIPQAPKAAQPVQRPQRNVLAKQAKSGGVVAARQGAWQRMKGKLFGAGAKEGVSTKQKVMAILIPVLFVFLIITLSKVLSTPSRKVKKPGKSGPATVAAGDDHKIDWQVPEPYSATERDPMLGVVGTGTESIVLDPTKATELIVNGILYSQNNPAAVIGPETVHVGDEILGATVVKINIDSVDFEKDGKTWSQKVQR